MRTMKNFKPALVAFALMAIIASMHAQSATKSITISSFCGNGVQSSLSQQSGIIPQNSILSGQGTGEQQVLSTSLLIILTMALVAGLIYMLSYVLNLELLRNMVKAEFGEIVLTAIVVFIFVGGFMLASAATSSQSFFAIGGSSFGRQTYVDDCTYLTSSSVGLIGPLVGLQAANYVIDTAESLKVSLTPVAFGVVFLPFQGYNLFDQVLKILSEVGWGFIVMVLGTLAMLGFVYGLFPIFLYAGIILRTLPWTRAAGGAFLGLFVGFYIVFPLVLHVMLASYIPSISSSATYNNPATANTIMAAETAASVGGAASGITAVGNVLSALVLFTGAGGSGQSLGLINGYLYFVIEPAAFTIFAIVLALIISFDFAELVGDLLGAPNLRGNITGKLLG